MPHDCPARRSPPIDTDAVLPETCRAATIEALLAPLANAPLLGFEIDIDIVGDRAGIRARRHGGSALAIDLGDGGRAIATALAAVGGELSIGGVAYRVGGGGTSFLLDRSEPAEAIDVGVLPGIPASVARLLDDALAMRHGLVVATGPAASGRQMIQNAIVGAIDARARSVAQITGNHGDRRAHVRHLCVDGVTRAHLLGSIAATRSDIVILDRIDTAETARVAIGIARDRLVFAAVDAADAVGAVGTLRRLRIDRFDLATTLRAIVAQCPAERLCPACTQPVQASGSVSALLGFDRGAVVHVAAGCPKCNGTGSAGMIGVFEGVVVDGDLSRLINSGGDSAILARHAFLRAPNLGSSARTLVREGVISAQEAVRLSRSATPDGPIAACGWLADGGAGDRVDTRRA